MKFEFSKPRTESSTHKEREKREQDRRWSNMWRTVVSIATKDIFTGESKIDYRVDNENYISEAEEAIEEFEKVKMEADDIQRKTLLENQKSLYGKLKGDYDDYMSGMIARPKNGFVERNQIEMRTDSVSREAVNRINAYVSFFNNRLRAIMVRREKGVDRHSYISDPTAIDGYHIEMDEVIKKADNWFSNLEEKERRVLDKSRQYNEFVKLKEKAQESYEPIIDKNNVLLISRSLIKDAQRFKTKLYGNHRSKTRIEKEQSVNRIKLYLSKVLNSTVGMTEKDKPKSYLKYILQNLDFFRGIGFEVTYDPYKGYSVEYNSKKQYYSRSDENYDDLYQYMHKQYRNEHQKVADEERREKENIKEVIRKIQPPLKSSDLDEYRAIISDYVSVKKEYTHKNTDSFFGYKYTGFVPISERRFIEEHEKNENKRTVFSLPTKYIETEGGAYIIKRMLTQMNIGSKYKVEKELNSETYFVKPDTK